MYAVFGNPIEHSLSPYLINKLLNISCSKISLGDSFDKKYLLDLLNQKKIYFGNVTYPYKNIFFNYSDSIKFPADRLSAINAFIYKDNKIISTNTDGEGFFYSLYSLNYNIYKKLINNKVILIAGSGSTAKSIAFSSKIRGITPIFLSREKFISNRERFQERFNKSEKSIIFDYQKFDYKKGLELILKNHNHIIVSTLPFSVLSILLKSAILKNEVEKADIINSKGNGLIENKVEKTDLEKADFINSKGNDLIENKVEKANLEKRDFINLKGNGLIENKVEKKDNVNLKESKPIENESEKNNKDNFLDIYNFFNYAYEKSIIIFDSNYKDYLSIKKNRLSININDNLFDGINQFIGQALLSIYFFTEKNFLKIETIKKIKEEIINESLR